ncbi:Bug family tripartite tricarboxylate transporter substrate binding protein [Variovorax sp. HJSM1_2]|uniref:Bug family tripartite tricarboxylate transporter substrate binding protein n=1 Tax=Variovorax sp. HJSM1_2 TaxID=3366263 RepID=UPI003BCAAEDB
MNRGKRFLYVVALLSAAQAVVLDSAVAQSTCSVIKMIVPNPPGGGGDVVSRIVGNKAATLLGQSFVVENKAGASTTIGTDFVAKAKPDGCTLLSLTASGVVITVLREKLPYNLQRDFVPIVGVGSYPMALIVPASSNLKTIVDVTKAAKGANGITYASGGYGTLAHLSAVRFLNEIGGTGTHIPFRGSPDAVQALLGGQVQAFFSSATEAATLVKGGRVRAVAVTSSAPQPELANVPTMASAGFADFSPRLWYAFLAPAGTPAQTVTQLGEAFTKALKDPGVLEQLASSGFSVEYRDQAAIAAYMKGEAVRWEKVIKDNGITDSN